MGRRGRSKMDKVLADTLTANLKHAATASAKIDAIVLAQIAIVDCQLKTSERVKGLVEERNAVKNKLSGAWIVGRLAYFCATIGGGVIAIKICKTVGILF